MKFLIPCSGSDRSALTTHARCILKFGGMDAHEIIYMPTPSARTAANEAADLLRAVGMNVTTAPLEVDYPGGWPMAPNMQFHWANEWMRENRPGSAFFWMEPDCLPRCYDWANKVAADYQKGGTAFRGHVVTTPWLSPEGVVIEHPGDVMMMGCGVYPPGIPNDELIAPLFYDLAKMGDTHPKEAFDRYLRWVFSRRGMSNSPVICDMWNTGSYTLTEGGQLTCKAQPFDKPRRIREGEIPAEAVVIHGCKDGTLAAIILGEAAPQIEPVANVAIEVASNPDCMEKSEADQWWASLSDTAKKELLAYTIRNGMPGAEGPDGIIGPVGVPGPDSPPEGIEWCNADVIRDRLSRGGYRLKDFKEEYKLQDRAPGFCENILAQIGFKVLRPAGWIQAK